MEKFLSYSVDKDLLNRGFKLESEKDEHSTFLKNGIYIRVYWDSLFTDSEGYSDSLKIYSLYPDISYYYGKSPKTPNDLSNLFYNIHAEI